jgi:Uncharacterized protein conserved in bacteria (DUF2059)
MKSIRMVAGLMIGAASAVAIAAPAPQVPPVLASKPVPDNAMRLSALLNPADKTLEVAMKAFETGITSAMKKSPDDAALFDRNPGVLQAITDASRPIVRRHLLEIIPVHQRRYAEFYAQKFSSEEIDQLIAFYSGPTGRKVIAAIYSGVDLNALAGKMDANGNLAAKDVQEAHAAAAKSVPDLLDADDWKAVFMFSATPAHAKLVSVGPEFNQLVAELENEPDPALNAEVDAAVKQAVKNYMAQKGRAHRS